ncbi:Katanin p80 (WD repeat containing) subunit B 1 [Perkinsus olseni]|uniref:Katanin p80 (WD repeat containing) subunit B 1 n=1 Tax=Perkinsus olseni TaxID=32597 RepID=A0A7J6QE70_PEROL|nr:Katanin p80 (WD repeat containing) subunit B 1 [Perkinsus olseni]
MTTFTAHTDRVLCCRLGLASGRLLVTGGEDRRVNVWRIERTGNSALMSLNGHGSAVSCAVFDRQEEIIASGCTGGGIKVWDVASSKLVTSLPGHKTECTTVEFHPYGSFFATASADTNIKIWDLRQQKCVQIYRGHQFGAVRHNFAASDGKIRVVRFSPHGKWLVGGGSDGSVRLWDLSAGKLLKDMEDPHKDAVTALDFHPADFYLVSGSEDRTCKLWNCDTFSLAGTSEIDHSAVKFVKFRPDGTSLLHGSQDALKVFSWDPHYCRIACEAVHPLPAPGQWCGASDIRISGSSTANRAVVVSHEGPQVRVWRLENLDELPVQASPPASERLRIPRPPAPTKGPDSSPASAEPRAARPKTALAERSPRITRVEPIVAETARAALRRGSPKPSNKTPSPPGSAGSSTVGEERGKVRAKRHQPRNLQKNYSNTSTEKPHFSLQRSASINESDLGSNKSPKSSPSPRSTANANGLRASTLSNPSFLKGLRKQLSAVKTFGRLWLEDCDVSAGLDVCCRGDKNSPGVMVGMLENVFHTDKSFVVTLAQCQKTFLPELRLLCGRPETRQAAMAAVRTLLRNFGSLIIGTRSAGMETTKANGQVDLSREDRLERCNSCFDQFASIHRLLAAEQHLRHRSSSLPPEVIDTMNELDRFITADNSSSNIDVNPNGR